MVFDLGKEGLIPFKGRRRLENHSERDGGGGGVKPKRKAFRGAGGGWVQHAPGAIVRNVPWGDEG